MVYTNTFKHIFVHSAILLVGDTRTGLHPNILIGMRSFDEFEMCVACDKNAPTYYLLLEIKQDLKPYFLHVVLESEEFKLRVLKSQKMLYYYRNEA